MIGVKLREILKIPLLKEARVLAGEEGLENYVTTVSVAEVPDILSWVKEGALYLTTLFAFRDENAQRGLVEGLSEKGAAGLVVKPRRFLETVPVAMIETANSLAFPLIEISPEVKWSELIPEIFERILEEEITLKVRGGFIEALITGDYSSEEEILRRGEQIGCNLKEPHRMVVVSIDSFSSYLMREDYSEEGLQKKKEEMFYLIKREFEKRFFTIFTFTRGEEFIILVREEGRGEVSSTVKEICEKVKEKLRPFTVSAGIGGVASNVSGMKRSYEEAIKALKTVRVLQGEGSFAEFKDVEEYSLLAELSESPTVKSFIYSTLGKLLEYDKKHQTELVETLKTYFSTGESKAKTAEKLYIHLNTLKYRLHKIEEILGLKLSDPDVSFRLKLAVRLLLFV
jgi:sugar diacid utilization regulator